MPSGLDSDLDEPHPVDPQRAMLRETSEHSEPEGDLALGPDTTTGAAEVLRRLRSRGDDASRYELRSRVARGGMGVILSAWDPVLRRTLAMKVVSDALGSAAPLEQIDHKTLGRFLEEAQVTGQLEHPGIVPVHELGIRSDGGVFFTMPLIKGRNLQQIFDLVHSGQEGWNTTRALGVILKVCEAMAYAHSKNVIHRDLKPANIMVGRFGEVYAMDWGVARVVGREDPHDIRLTQNPPSSPAIATDRSDEASVSGKADLFTMDGDVVGTPAYMAPEQAMGKLNDIDARSDVYSIGAMLYHLLTRKAPFSPEDGAPQNLVLLRVLKGPPAPLHELTTEVPMELAAICEKAMAREKSQRYASVDDLASDLRAYLERRVVKAYETGAVAEIKKWIVRNKGMASASAVALGLMIVGLATSSILYVRAARNERLAESRRVTAALSAEEAERSAKLAGERQQEAEAAKLKVLRLSDVKRLEKLVTEATFLWPAFPDRIDLYRSWLARARELTGRLEEHQIALGELRAAATPAFAGRSAPEAVGESLGGASADEMWILPSAEEQWQHDVLAELVSNLELFTDADAGLLPNVESRLEFAQAVSERTVTGERPAALWAEAIDAIAETPRYRGLTLTPQLGLLPIGRDPDSELWEFAHVQTGEVPSRDGDGRLVMTEESCLVLVLIPSTRFLMGAQSSAPNEPNYDPQARDNEAPVHEVELAPYFISKYEMTQGQWLRIESSNPSHYNPSYAFATVQHDLRHPVEQVSWEDCTRTLSKLDLTLPTEAQWEHAARSETQTPWWSGAERESLVGLVNLADQTGARAGATWPDINEWPELDDGSAAHAPVGTYAANLFGLHEVHGNVFEWCLDLLGEYAFAVTPGTGQRQSTLSYRVYRGGSFLRSASSARSSYRDFNKPDYFGSSLGVRPARPVRD